MPLGFPLKGGLTIPIRGPLIGWGSAPVIPVYDPDAQALFARMATQPDAQRKQLISDRFVAGKAKSFWAKLDALWVHAAHEPVAARLNWVGAVYDCIPVNNPAFTIDRGYMGDGSSSYLNTQFNPVTAVNPKYVRDSGCLGIRSNTDNVAAGSLAGFFNGSTGTTINPRSTPGNFAVRLNCQSSLDIPSSASAIGMFAANRSSQSNIEAYRDGVLQGFNARGSEVPANGALRLGSITDASFRACQFSMGWISAGLTQQEHRDVFDWFEVYRLALEASAAPPGMQFVTASNGQNYTDASGSPYYMAA